MLKGYIIYRGEIYNSIEDMLRAYYENKEDYDDIKFDYRNFSIDLEFEYDKNMSLYEQVEDRINYVDEHYNNWNL